MADDDEDFTELRDADIDSVHAVGKAANGTRILLAKQADGGAGLFGPDFVRDLIAKGESDGEYEAAVAEADQTLTLARTYGWTPTQISGMSPLQRSMALVHAASIRKADMSTASINDLPDSAFAHIEPGGSKDDSGKTTPRSKRHFPVHDAAHVRNALARAPQSPFGDKAMPKIRAAAAKFGVQVAKADADTPGSPAWEAADADMANSAIGQLKQLRNAVCALAAREGTEVGAGHMDDVADVMALQCVDDLLSDAMDKLAAFAAREQYASEPAAMAKQGARPDPTQAVHDTMAKLAQAHGCPACQGFLAAAQAADGAARPPEDATDGPAAATDQGLAPATPPEQTMTKSDAAVDTTQTTPAAPAGDEQSKKTKKLAKSAAEQVVAEQLAPITDALMKQGEALAQLAKAVETLNAQPMPSGLAMNGATPGAAPMNAPALRGDAVPGIAASGYEELRKQALAATDPMSRDDLRMQAVQAGMKEIFSRPPTMR